MPYDEKRVAELLLHVAEATESDETAGSTKYNKILYFADLTFLRRFGRTITGATYQKNPNGPTLRRMLPIVRRLTEEGAAKEVERDFLGKTQKRLLALRRPDLSAFEAEEISVVDAVIRELWGMTATKVSELSHDDLGWRAVGYGDDIPLELAFIETDPVVTDEMRERARKLAANLPR